MKRKKKNKKLKKLLNSNNNNNNNQNNLSNNNSNNPNYLNLKNKRKNPLMFQQHQLKPMKMEKKKKKKIMSQLLLEMVEKLVDMFGLKLWKKFTLTFQLIKLLKPKKLNLKLPLKNYLFKLKEKSLLIKNSQKKFMKMIVCGLLKIPSI